MHSRSYDFLYLLQDWYGVFVLCFVGSPVWSIGSLSNDDSYAVDNVGWKMNLFFTYESCDTPKSFSLFLTVKIISKLNMEHSVELEIGIWKD